MKRLKNESCVEKYGSLLFIHGGMRLYVLYGGGVSLDNLFSKLSEQGLAFGMCFSLAFFWFISMHG